MGSSAPTLASTPPTLAARASLLLPVDPDASAAAHPRGGPRRDRRRRGSRDQRHLRPALARGPHRRRDRRRRDAPVLDYVGQVDAHGHELRVTTICAADELAGPPSSSRTSSTPSPSPSSAATPTRAAKAPRSRSSATRRKTSSASRYTCYMKQRTRAGAPRTETADLKQTLKDFEEKYGVTRQSSIGSSRRVRPPTITPRRATIAWSGRAFTKLCSIAKSLPATDGQLRAGVYRLGYSSRPGFRC